MLIMKWENELYNHEVSPPDHVWNRISHDLDNEFLVFKHKLYDAEATPPDNSWNNIRHMLDARPATTGIKKWLRIAAAAALVGVSFFTINYFIAGGNHTHKTTAINEDTSTRAPKDQTQADDPGNNEKVTQVKPAPLIASHTRIKKNSPASGSDVGPVFYKADEAYSAPPVSSIPDDNTAITDRYNLEHNATRHIRNLKGEIKEDVSLLDLPNSYFLMTGPNGQAMRVSSKFRNTIQYLNSSGNEELLDVILRESQYWRNQFSTWKEQVGHSTFIPSAENFMDIAELMKLLQDPRNK